MRALLLVLIPLLYCSLPLFAQTALPPPAQLPALATSTPVSADPAVAIVRNGAASPSYKPLGVVGKLGAFARSSYSLNVWASAALTAGIPHLVSIPPKPPKPTGNLTPEQSDAYDLALQQYETTAERARDQIQEEVRWRGRRFISGFAEAQTRQFLQNFMLPVIIRQDPRYFKAEGRHNAGYRMLYGLSRVAVTRSDSGHSTFNFSHILGAFGAAAAARYYYDDSLQVPQLATTSHMLKSAGGSLALDSVLDMVREFWPERKR